MVPRDCQIAPAHTSIHFYQTSRRNRFNFRRRETIPTRAGWRGACRAATPAATSATTFWTILALRLQEPRLGLGADVAGLFGIVGIVGAVGILAAPIADRSGPHRVIAADAVLTLVSWLIFGFWTSLAVLIAGVVLLDFAVQAVLVSNQHVAYALRPQARARLDTIFMGAMFLAAVPAAPPSAAGRPSRSSARPWRRPRACSRCGARGGGGYGGAASTTPCGEQTGGPAPQGLVGSVGKIR